MPRPEKNYDARSFGETRAASGINAIPLLIWLLAGVVVFLPFALDTPPWDAVARTVPGEPSTWWQALVGAPFFLAFLAIWTRQRSLISAPARI